MKKNSLLDSAEEEIDKQLLKLKIKLKKWYMNIIKINGESFDVKGRNIRIGKVSTDSNVKINGMNINNLGHIKNQYNSGQSSAVYVDNVLIKDNLNDDIKIEFIGDLANLNCINAVVNGDVRGNIDATNVKCDKVGGSIDATNVKCGKVSGSIDATKVTIKK